MDTSGFYSLQDGELLYAPNFVYGPGFTLRDTVATHRARTDTPWLWFTTQAAAYEHYQYVPPVVDEGVSSEPVEETLPEFTI